MNVHFESDERLPNDQGLQPAEKVFGHLPSFSFAAAPRLKFQVH
jgi:hypothetical protein